MHIRIEFKLYGKEPIRSFILAPGEYFDPLDTGENYEDDGIPVFNDVRGFVAALDSSVELENVEYIIETIEGSLHSDKSIITKYYGRGASMITNRRDADGYESVIQSVRVAENCILINKIERLRSTNEWTFYSSIGVNYEAFHTGEEHWYSPMRGEYLKTTLEVNQG